MHQNYYSPLQNGSFRKWFAGVLCKLETIMKYVCEVCGWEYDPAVGVPEAGIPAGTPWEEVPESFECPVCAVGKDSFAPAE